jgi:hypothetical protein
MDGDFGAELDAALNRNLAQLREAAAAARDRVDAGIAGMATDRQPAEMRDFTPDQLPPIAFDPGPPRPVAAVSFDMDEDFVKAGVPSDDIAFETAVDAEGIPLPEENF